MNKTKGKLFINEFGNGFINTDIKNDNTNNNITIYILKDHLNNAFHNEIVEVEYYEEECLFFGKIINYSLLNKTFIGIVHHIYKNEYYIYCPELKKSNLICIQSDLHLYPNIWVSVIITSNENNKLYGTLLEIIKYDVDIILEKKFKLKELSKNDIELNNSINNKNIIYKDETQLDTFTIDPITCMDCDDAFSIKIIDSKIHIYVHISDVSYYINPTISNFDEIIKRGNTYYGFNKNWTMIPENYANNICSILPNKKTYVITNHFIYDNNELEYVDFYCSIIESKNKYSYEYVDNNFDMFPFKILYETSLIIKKDIYDFNVTYETNSHFMIKYWMIKVNQIMSDNINKIHRCNPIPQNNKFKLLNYYMNFKNTELNIHQHKEIINFIDNNKSDLLFYIIKSLLPKAYYTTNNIGHYALGISNYTHWTSPIRRSCDLLNHCILKGYDIDVSKYIEYMNEAELIQDSIEKFIIQFKNNEKIMVNDIFDGIIIGLNDNGITLYIKDLDDKITIHVSKLSSKKIFYNKIDNILKNDLISYQLFDNLKIKVIKKFFDLFDFEIFI